MPRQKGTGKGKTGRFNIRLDEETANFYRSEANQHGLDASEYLRQLLLHGAIAANAVEIQENFKYTATEIQAN